jgi:carboxyl-terminal processing protease
MNTKNAAFPIIVALALVLGFLLGNGLYKQKLPFNGPTAQQNFGSKLDGILDVIEKKYVDPIDRNSFVEKAIDDILHKLDPHSAYVPASHMKAMMEGVEGKFGGVGVRFAIMRDSLCVTYVMPNSPSERAGVLAGDRIIQINDIKLSKEKLNNKFVMDNLKGDPNTNVDVLIYRKGKKVAAKIKRGVIPIESISAKFMVDKQVGYIRLDQFSLNSAEEFRQASSDLKAQGMRKLVFDLRDNGGGVLGGAIEIVDEFLEADKLIVYTKGAHQKERHYKSTSRGVLKDIPVVVLINQNSASASEIVAGALQDNDRATIIGRRSFGKGLVQEDITLRDESNLRLTVARYYTPTGRSIQRPYGDEVDYEADFMERYDKGELYKVDSTKFFDSLKFKTPKGKVVYGGGGIMPDIFHPQDSPGMSFYFTELRYAGAFNQFTFFEWDVLGRNKYKSLQEFIVNYTVSNDVLNRFVQMAEKDLKIKRNDAQFAQSKTWLERYIKAELARHIWIEQGFFQVFSKGDSDLQRALQFFSSRN